jgi:maltose O-acetyltransferase
LNAAAEGIISTGEGEIHCGRNGYMGRHCTINAYKGCKIVIGENCAISRYVTIYTMNYAADQNFDIEMEKRDLRAGDVFIGDNCWICANVFITEGVKIGENAVIGANSVVTRNLPPHCIAAGNPAKVIKFKSYLSESEKLRLTKEFWDTLSDSLKIKYVDNIH